VIRAAVLLLAFAPLAASAQTYPEAHRIAAIGGTVTEILYDLGAGDRLAARDTTSTYPPAALALPDIGYMRQLSAEGVLSVSPDLILLQEGAGPPATVDQLRATAVPVVGIPDGHDAAAVPAAILAVAEAVGLPEKGQALAATAEADLDRLSAEISASPARPRVLFLLSASGGTLMAAGRETGADGLLQLAGAVNVMAQAFAGYKPVSAEAILAADPAVVVMMQGGPDHGGTAAQILALPAFAGTTAAADRAFVQVDPAALSFGPRTAGLARGLRRALTGSQAQ